MCINIELWYEYDVIEHEVKINVKKLFVIQKIEFKCHLCEILTWYRCKKIQRVCMYLWQYL